MRILLTNDDGVHAEGLWAIYRKFSENHSVTVVAPDRERSAISHGISLNEALRIRQINVYGGYPAYSINGTPADCVNMGIMVVLGGNPDLVISGINPGLNMGNSVSYSGTVAAAREAALHGIPAIAVSIFNFQPSHYDTAAVFAEILAKHVLENGLPFGTFLNVNVPDIPMEKVKGVRICRQETGPVSEYFEKRIDPRNQEYYWLGAEFREAETDSDTERGAIFRKYISVTPLKCDITDYNMIEKAGAWDIRI
ncbi:MAG: 5'/3'-nucleotidase SurE [Desulfobacteraceae bacterium IS3]|nr:MAG: 5'/3'-nucleotidase SurE [Desulfobacteraceae bacterium IS3]